MAARGAKGAGETGSSGKKIGLGRGSWSGSNPSVTGTNSSSNSNSHSRPTTAATAAAVGVGSGHGSGTGSVASNTANSSANNSRPSSRGGATAASTTTTMPSTASSTTGTSTQPLSDYLDLPVKLSLVASGQMPQRDVSGTLFAYDPASSTVVLSSSASSVPQSSPTTPSAKRSFHMIKTSQIRDVTVLSTTPDASLAALAVDPDAAASVPSAELASRVERAVQEDARQRARIGPKGVSDEGQGLFDALAKTLPCRWHEQSIVVMDEVMISPPYGTSDVKGNKPERVERVRKIVRCHIMLAKRR